MVNLRINDKPVTVEDGTSILHAARQIGITIPSLCYLKHVSKVAACRVCMVEIKGTDRLTAAATTTSLSSCDRLTRRKPCKPSPNISSTRNEPYIRGVLKNRLSCLLIS